MVTAASCDDSILSAYVHDPTSVPPADVACAVQRIIIAVATPNNVSKPTVKVAQNVLASLFQSPHPDIIASLLPVCDLGVPFDNVDQFVLCTAAWKALSAAVVQETSAKTLPAATFLKIIASAVSAGFSMLLRAISIAQALETSGSGSVGRWTKVAKFFILHATRCAQVFSKKCDRASVMTDERTKQLFTDAFGHASRLLGLLAYSCFLSDHEFRVIRDDLATGLSPLVTSLIRSILTTFCLVIEGDPPSFAMYVLDTTNKSFSNPSLFMVDKNTPCSPALLHMFATLQIMRYAASDPPDVTSESAGKASRDFRALRRIFRRSLCATLFVTLDNCYDKIVTVRERVSQTPLIITVASVAAECFAVVELNDVKANDKSVMSLSDSLLIQMSAVNPARAFVAAEGLYQIFRALLARFKPGQSLCCTELLTSIMMCSRMAFALRSAHAESRWLQLTARIANLCIAQDGMLVRALNESRTMSGSPGKSDSESTNHDLFLLRLVRAICHDSSVSFDNDAKNGASGPLSIPMILNCVQLDVKHIQNFVVQVLSKSSVDDDLTQCAVMLAPHVMDEKHALDITAKHIKLGGLSAAAFCIGMSAMQPSVMQTDVFFGLVHEARSYVERYGVVVCAAVSAFVSRLISSAGTTGRPAVLTELLGLLRILVEKVVTTGGDEHDATVINALSGCVYYHAANALSSLGSTVTPGGVDVNGVLGNGVLTVIEKSQERHLELKQRLEAQGDDDWATVVREKDHIATETSSCRRGETRLLRNKSGDIDKGRLIGTQAGSIQSIRESLVGLLGDIVHGALEGDDADNRCASLRMELNELRRTVDCIEDWCNNGK